MDKLRETEAEKEIKALYDQLATIVEDREQFRKVDIASKLFAKKWTSRMIKLGLASIIAMVIGVFWNIFVVVGVLLLIACYGCFFYYMIKSVYNNMDDLKRFFTKPFEDSITYRLDPLSQFICKKLPIVKQYSTNTLKIVKASLELEYQNFPKRSAIFIGAIETIGLLPAVLALLSVFFSLQNLENLSWWIYSFAICYVFFVVLAIFIQQEVMRYSQLIKLLTLAIEEKKD